MSMLGATIIAGCTFATLNSLTRFAGAGLEDCMLGAGFLFCMVGSDYMGLREGGAFLLRFVCEFSLQMTRVESALLVVSG